MGTLTITGHVTRPELALPDLSLNTDTYKIIRGGWGPGSTVWERQAVGSPFSSGRYLVNAKKGPITAPLAIRVTGTTKADVQNVHVPALVSAFEQFDYQVSMVIEGVTYTWNCEPADWSYGDGGQLQPFHLMSYKQEITFEVTRHPIPVAGPF